MAEMSTIVEGKVKYRDGKKWKPRWCVMKKPSPVADRLLVYLYKDVRDAVKGLSAKSSFPLDGFYGLESGICIDKETSVLAIICNKQITLLAFDSRETLIQFEIKIRRSLGEEHQFPVRTIKVPSHSKLPLDLLRMHIHGSKFCLTGHIPPKILGSWQVSELRRFGAIDGKFCFEGGSRCGKGAGFHVLQTDQVEEISEIISRASAGKSAPIIRRQTGKRRSEFLEPSKQSVSDAVFKKFENRQVFADQNYHDDNSWPRYKRHSISFTDFRRGKTYTDKQHLQSIENVEKERLMAIYDVPPRRIRKVEQKNFNSENSSARSFDENFNAFRNIYGQSSQGNENYLNWTGEFNNNVMSYQVPRNCVEQSDTVSVDQSETTTITSSQSDSTSPIGSVLSLQCESQDHNTMSISSSAPVLCNFVNEPLTNHYKHISQSVPGEKRAELDRVLDIQHDEVMRSLDQSQQEIEKEMSLLDEMLQVCQRTEGDSEWDQQPPPLPLKQGHQYGNPRSQGSGVRGSLDNISISSDNTHCRPCPRSGTTNSLMLSPNLVNKLKRIPKRSHFNAPLPYVNLSKYDGVDGANHVHVPAVSTSAPDGGNSLCDLQRSRSRNAGYDNVPSGNRLRKDSHRVSLSLPGSHENLQSISSSDLRASAHTRNNSFSYEPIYANTREETPPPELPPKGPNLRYRPKPMVDMASRPPAPPRPPERRPVKQRSQNNSSPFARQVSYKSSQEEDYFMMGSFEKEPTHCRIDYNEPCRMVDPLTGRQVVSLPPKEKKYTQCDVEDSYMEMAGIMELDKSKSGDIVNSSQRPTFMRSISASGVESSYEDTYSPLPPPRTESVSVSAGNSPREQRRETLIREENYILMSSVTPDKPSVCEEDFYINSSIVEEGLNRIMDVKKELTFTSDDYCEIDGPEGSSDPVFESDKQLELSNIEMPFDNLLDFTLPFQQVNRKPVLLNPNNDKLDTASIKSESSNSKGETSSGKAPGFFSRLMRRNSRDRKSVSQSQENLLATSLSEPTIKEDVVIQEYASSSSSEGSSRSQSQQDLVFPPKDRSRSSSFPNRSSYVAMNPESNSSSSTGISILSQHSGATNSSLNSCETVSTHTSSTEGNLNAQENDSALDPEKDECSKGNYDQQSYFFMGPLESRRKSNKEKDTIKNDLYESQQPEVSKVGDNTKSDFNKEVSDENGGKVFTVLNVQGDSCKTDDEKLIELWHSTHSLSEKGDKIADLKSKLTLPLEELSPDEKASAIAKHISSLPPFIPPKMKSYPTKLSPVLERNTPKGDKPDPLDMSMQEGGPGGVESPVLSPSLMKLQAKATLRITPPSEDEHGKIWIPRTAVQPEDETQSEISEADSQKTSTLVVEVSEMGEGDNLSLGSVDSGTHQGDEMVRSSPASTILRPRSGKEYQKVERRRTLDDSVTTSPLMTPQSPNTGSVFTFDNIVTSSFLSGSEVQSSKFFKSSSSDQSSIITRSESMRSPTAMYMNIDFTGDMSPPESPLLVPAEQIEPMLNYAEIDLSEAGRSETANSQARMLNYAEMDLSIPERFGNTRKSTKKSKKAAEPVPVEYSMIDMVATRAAQKARKDHAQSRDGSLHRERYSSNSLASSGSRERQSLSGSSTKERLATLSLSKADKRQAAASNAGKSTTSVESSNF
ncbi:uncharacterized protein LOC128217750 isoform X1 [Mya arenaria]|uniref:uncharacterized protein LOC128217750 isoform X1 n=1 Tax=Mya arenaria TaxID=6604 RepID=UPI0022E32D73|nr:uncharacterized protein LOC128217750 isoform X1 [Mya arenaria]